MEEEEEAVREREREQAHPAQDLLGVAKAEPERYDLVVAGRARHTSQN